MKQPFKAKVIAKHKKKPDIEDQIINLRMKANKVALKFHNEESALRNKLKNCSHRYVVAWEWEHDNGYGVQKRIKGERCSCCLRTRGRAGTGPWYDPKCCGDLT
jgi:hypothetical protein